jgi:hypothetical protein
MMRRLLALLMLGATVALSYGLARIGEPQSLWLWRDMLGIVQ